MPIPLGVLLAILGCSNGPSREAPPDATPAELPVTPPLNLAEMVGQPVGLRARDLVLQVEGARIEVPYLVGRLVPVGEYVDLDVPTSFVVEINAVELRIPEQSLQHAIGGPGGESPFRELTVRTEGEVFVLEGNARMMNLPFMFRANPRITDTGKLALDLEKVRVLGVGMRGFLNTFSGRVERAVNGKPQRGMLRVEEDLMILDPFPFAGPPEVRAVFTAVEVHEGGLVARLGEAPEPTGPSGISLDGGVLRSGSSLLFGTTVSLVARDGGPLEIDPARLGNQLEAGFTKMGDRTITLHVAPL